MLYERIFSLVTGHLPSNIANSLPLNTHTLYVLINK